MKSFPEGCSAAYVPSCSHFRKSSVDWDEIAEEYGDRIIEALEVEMPDLRNHIVTRRHITPKTFESELAAFKGSAFSVAPKLTQKRILRPSNEDSGIPGLPCRRRNSPRCWIAGSSKFCQSNSRSDTFKLSVIKVLWLVIIAIQNTIPVLLPYPYFRKSLHQTKLVPQE